MVSPKHESGINPMSLRGDPAKDSEHQQRRKNDERELDKESGRNQYGKDSCRHSDRYSSRSSHGYSRHDQYSRREKRSDDEERHYQTSSRSSRESRGVTYSDHTIQESEHGRSRNYLRNADKYSHDKYDSSKLRTKDKEIEPSSLDRQKFRDKDASPDIAGASRKHALTSKEKDKDKEIEPSSLDRQKFRDKDASPDIAGASRKHALTSKEKDRDRNGRDRDAQDEKRDYHRSVGDHKSDHSSGRDHDGPRNREFYKNDQKELNEEDWKKCDDWDSNRDKDRYSRAPQEQNEDKPVYGMENQEPPAKKPKLFSSGGDADYSKNANEKQKQVPEIDGKVTVGQVHMNNFEAANDFNAAKVAAMKAAELVNKNLVGVGFMSTEQKKKLLWGNKKSTTSEESGHRWDASLFDDRERQEKFNKLMGVKGDVNVEHKLVTEDGSGRLQAEKQKEVQMDLEKQYTAGLRRRDGRTVGLGL